RHDTGAGRKSTGETAGHHRADTGTADRGAWAIASQIGGARGSRRPAARGILRVRRASAKQHPKYADRQREDQLRAPGKMRRRRLPGRTVSTAQEPELRSELGDRARILLREAGRELLRAIKLFAREA